MANYIINTVFGPAVRVFEMTIIFKHKDTGKYRVADKTSWVWAKTKEEAVEHMDRFYSKSNEDASYLESVLVRAQAIELVGEPNPANIRDMEKGDSFMFSRDKPGILIDKWGY